MKLLGGVKQIITVAVGLFLLLFLGYWLILHRPSVAVIKVQQVDIQGEVRGPGTVQSKVPVAVSSKITGILEKLYADQGDLVKKGQLLAELDTAELKARLAAARAAQNRAQKDLARARAILAKAQANLALAQSNYRRDQEVFKGGYISQAAMDTTSAALKVAEGETGEARANVAASEAAVQQADAEARAAAATLDYARILAPMDGLLTVRKAEVGDTITPGVPIFKMVELDWLWVAAWIDETQIAALKEGQEAQIRLRSGRIFPGTVVRLNKEADMVTREMEVDVKFASPPEPVVVGEEAEVAIATGRTRAIAVPWTAVEEQDGQSGVLVVEGGVVKFRPVKLGLRDRQQVAVEQGLKEGELVVVPASQTKPGQKVKGRLIAGK
jgi:HlyD family secretion protein|uniref:Efflux RND transporter periplasmic adaptor subunit n=1 Tax=Desulfobacca acetoxidans TaxID=60893 RepID=A0A7C3WGB0_9BACT